MLIFAAGFRPRVPVVAALISRVEEHVISTFRIVAMQKPAHRLTGHGDTAGLRGPAADRAPRPHDRQARGRHV